MKKFIRISLCLLSCLCLLVGCGKQRAIKDDVIENTNYFWLNSIDFNVRNKRFLGHLYDRSVKLPIRSVSVKDEDDMSSKVPALTTCEYDSTDDNMHISFSNPTDKDMTVKECMSKGWKFYTFGDFKTANAVSDLDRMLGLPESLIEDADENAVIPQTSLLDAFVNRQGAPSYVRLYGEADDKNVEPKEMFKKILTKSDSDIGSLIEYSIGYEYNNYIIEISIWDDTSKVNSYDDIKPRIVDIAYFDTAEARDAYAIANANGKEGESYYTYTADDMLDIYDEIQKG